MRIDFRAVAAILLAIGVSGTLLILAWNEFRTKGHVTQEEANLLSVLGGAGIGAVATYLGGAGGGGGDRGGKDDPGGTGSP